MSAFEDNRELIIALDDSEAKCILSLLDNWAAQTEAPPRLRKALAAAQLCPDVARYFLVEKTQGRMLAGEARLPEPGGSKPMSPRGSRAGSESRKRRAVALRSKHSANNRA